MLHLLRRKSSKSGFQTVRLGTFNIVLTVDPPLAPLALAATEDIGPAGVALPAGKALPITGGKPPYSLTNVTRQVPTGISIMPDGTLTGTSTAPGDYSLTIDLQDANG
jgi:Putative Ig domain